MTTPYRVAMLPNVAAGVDVYETFETQEQAETRKAEVLSSILSADDDDLTRISREPHSGVCLRYFSPRLSAVENLSGAHRYAAEVMRKRWNM